MTRHSFNADWTVRPKVSVFAQVGAAMQGGDPVTLPHDAMLSLNRSAEKSEGLSSGYYPGGAVEYAKAFFVPDEWRDKRVSVEFQGVYRDAMVFVNGDFAGQRRNGYATFRVPIDAFLRYGETNTIRVDARSHLDSRWYSGLGIYRDTVLIVTQLAHIAADGVRITTPDVDSERAVVEVATTVENEDISTRELLVHTELRDDQGVLVASDTALITLRAGRSAVVRQRMYVAIPQRWSVEQPYLYRSQVALRDAIAEVDVATVRFGIRTLRLDPHHGLRINDAPVKLRGACIHHDNGLLGSAAIRRAEERKIELLKAAGFNAIRSSHNPVSHALLDACDQLGMLVVDETFDVWLEGKSNFDYAVDFPEWWERDVESMVAKDFNHPSVIMYSIGNEILDVGTGLGSSWGRELAEKVRSIDDTRLTTNAISGFVAVVRQVLPEFQQQMDESRARGVNDAMSEMIEMFDQISLSDFVTDKTAESHSIVDVAGLNYAAARYLPDAERFPNRIMLGTETNPRDIDRNWQLVRDLSYVLGDFTWTGWDYLGEAGLGRTDYTDDPAASSAPDPAFPWLLAWCGDIDITGHRRPASYYREIVFGLRHEPYIAVFRPEHYGKRRFEMPWAWSDVVSSWTWNVAAGSPVEVEVYSDADEVELLLDGERIGRAPAGSGHRFRACFDVPYRPGKLTAVAFDGGIERSRSTLKTALGVALTAESDRRVIQADHGDLAYVSIELRDADGTLNTAVDAVVEVSVAGPGVLQALGSARPSTEERFDAPSRTTFDGRALAVIRPLAAGIIAVTVAADGLSPVTLEIESREAVAGHVHTTC